MIRAALRSILPVLHPVAILLFDAWIRVRTWGMHPMAPHYSSYALRRATLKGGVRV